MSVILTCYNEGAFIGEAVRSVLGQTCSGSIDRIVIADDGSAPGTLSVLRDIETWDPRIVVIYGPGGAGLPAQRNRAIAATQAPFFAVLDGDDLWSPDKLERELALMSDPSIGLVYSRYMTFATDPTVDAHSAAVLDITQEPDLLRAYFCNDPPIIPSTTLIRRSAFDACKGFDDSIRVFEDTDFYLRMARVCRFGFVNASLLYKRSHAASITGGRKDLMAFHALVAFKAASLEPRLMPLVPRRLAERARKLGNHYFLLGDATRARPLLALAVRLDPINVRAWCSWLASGRLSGVVRALMAKRWKKRRVSMGVADQEAIVASAGRVR